MKRGYVYFGDGSVIPAMLLPPITKGKPHFHDQSRNGVHVLVHRVDEGTTVHADCACLGVEGRTHSNLDCPFRRASLSRAE